MNSKLEPVILTDEERRVLIGWSRQRDVARALAVRSQIVLACAEGGAIGDVAAAVGVSRNMVSKWRSRFLAARLDGLSDGPRPGRPRTISDERIEGMIVKTLAEAPRQDTCWSTRSMAAASGLSQSSVSRIWRAFGITPQARDSSTLLTDSRPTDPQFPDKIRTAPAATVG